MKKHNFCPPIEPPPAKELKKKKNPLKLKYLTHLYYSAIPLKDPNTTHRHLVIITAIFYCHRGIYLNIYKKVQN